MSFGDRLVQATRARGALCVGIDPHPTLLERWGLPDSAAGLRAFCSIAVEAFAGTVAVLKPQSAFFERFGSAGIAVLESTIRQSREAGALVLLDVKRGDIGSTAQAYADAYLDPASGLCADAVTVSPYLGLGSITPFLETAQAHGGGVFVLAVTSNPDGRQVQHARMPDGRTVAQAIIDGVAARNEGARPLGSVGLVVGATTGGTGHDLSKVNGPVLAPGLGTQGATPDDLRVVFGDVNGLVLPSCSREILAHGPSVEALRKAADGLLNECRKVLKDPFL